MKTTIALIMVLFSIVYVSAQHDPLVDILIDFSQNDSTLYIDTTLNNNLWEIGQPNKPYFDSAYSIPNAICTDLDSNYQSDNYSSFQLTVISDYFGTGQLDFSHKYSTDLGHAGGYIEVSYDQGKTWSNIIEDKNWKINLYQETDTIVGNIPSYTGNSNGWKEVNCYFLWYALVKKNGRWPPGWGLYMNDNPDTLLFKFNFISSNDAIPKPGWLIDDLKIRIWDVSNSTNENLFNKWRISYQPEYKTIKIFSVGSADFNYSLLVYDIQGRKVLQINNSPERLNVHKLKEGFYIIQIISSKSNVHSEKIFIY